MFRNVALKCLTEIAGISIAQYPQYEATFRDMFRDTLAQLKQVWMHIRWDIFSRILWFINLVIVDSSTGNRYQVRICQGNR